MHLTTHRRRFTVARRDPMIQQRQYFARRRENQHNAPRVQVRQAIDSFRRPERTPADNNHGRRALEQPLPVGTDYLMLANPSANDSIIGTLRRPKRPRLAESRGERPERTDKVDNEPDHDLDLDVSNDIRVFDDDVEKTYQFRRRMLPNDFLNSQITRNDPRRGLQAPGEHSRDPRLRMRSWLDHDRRNDRDSGRVVRRRRNPSPLPSPDPIQMDHVVDMREQSRITSVIPESAYRREIRSPERLRRQIPSKRFRSPTSSPFEDRAISSRFEEDEVVEATPSDDAPRTVYKDFLLGISPDVQDEAKSRVPTAKKLLSTLTAISPHFPPVKVDTDSSESLTMYRPTKSEEIYKFRSLLSNEEITSGQFSANVQELESKLLNLPDRDVPFLSVSKTLADRKKTKSNILRNVVTPELQFRTPKECAAEAFARTFEPDFTHAKTKMKTSLPSQPRPRHVTETNMDEAKLDDPAAECQALIIPKSRNGGSIGMKVALGSDARNPVTLAADGATSEMTIKEGG